MQNFTRQPGPDYAATMTIEAPAETTYAALTTADGIRGWWTAYADGSAEPGGEFRVEFPAYDIYKTAMVGAGSVPGDRQGIAAITPALGRRTPDRAEGSRWRS